MRRDTRGLAAAVGAGAWAALALATPAAAQEQTPAAAAGAAADGISDGIDQATPVAAPTAPEPSLPPPPPGPTPTLSEAVAGGKLILEVRPRYELVDQDNFAKHAEAFTIRTRLGWETGDFHGFKALMEFEDVRAIGGQRYNSSINGRTQYPVIGDPPVTELNRGQIAWTPNPYASAVVGRQRINLDDQRFVGAAAWRQDEQTFDAARLDLSWGRWKGTYIYLDRINRVFGQGQDWDSDSHAANLTFSPAEALKLEGFVYALDFKQSAANSGLTYGVRATGQLWASLIKLNYAGAYARQTDYRGNTAPFGLNYWSGELAASFDVYTLKANYEVLGGNGARGFATPLATLHAFQGWADVFLTTPTVGIRDANLTFSAQPRFKWTYLYNTTFLVRHHRFRADFNDLSLGSEWDLQAAAQINPKLSGLIKYAIYDGPDPVRAPYFSRSKLWLQLEYKL